MLHIAIYYILLYYNLLQTTAVYSNLTSTLCGSGDTSVLQQASGIITLLLVAICALIF